MQLFASRAIWRHSPLDLKMFGVAPVAPILKRWRGDFTLAHFSPKIAKMRGIEI